MARTDQERALVSLACEALFDGAGIEAERVDWSPNASDLGLDGTLTLARGDQRQSWSFTVKHRLRPGLVPLLSERRRRGELERPFLVITDNVTPGVAAALREEGIAFLDAAGNAWLDSPPWLVWVEGRTRPASTPQRSGLSPAVWKVAYVLLKEPSAAELPVRSLGDLAGVSHGTVSVALKALEERGWVRRLGHSGAPVTDSVELHAAWEVGYLDRLRPQLEVARVRPVGRTLREFGQAVLEGEQAGVCLGGELACELGEYGIVAATGALHVPTWGPDLMSSLRLLPSPEGPITVLESFGARNPRSEGAPIADPILLRAELLSIRDERLGGVRSKLLSEIRARWG